MRKVAPRHIVEELQRYDPLLRIRWSKQRRKWVVERKIYNTSGYIRHSLKEKFLGLPVRFLPSHIPGYEPYQIESIDSEAYIQYRDGYTTVAVYDVLDRRVILEVLGGDAWKFGDYGKRYRAHETDRQQKEQERKKRKEFERTWDKSKQIYDDLSWQTGRTISVAH
jgi:hypothetical protein